MASESVQQQLARAIEHHQAGRMAEAEAQYRQILVAEPKHHDALHLLGVIACQGGQFEDGVDLIRRAVAINPASPAARDNLASAETGYVRQAFGIALQHHQAGRLAEAEPLYRRVLAIQPEHPDALHLLGLIECQSGRHASGIELIRQAIARHPECAEPHSNLGNALSEVGRLEEGIASCRRAIALKPDLADAHYNLAFPLLLKGDFAQGWEEYEWRWKRPEFLATDPEVRGTCWDGSPLPNGTLLVHAEQGFGDTIQFSRYVPLAAERCRQVIVVCQPAMRRLLAGKLNATWIAKGEPLPRYDAQLSLMGLPRVFGTTLETIPSSKANLKADPTLAERWREQLSNDRNEMTVGLAWAGNTTHKNNRNRSMPRSALAPLGAVPGVGLYSLQKVVPPEDAKGAPEGMTLVDWTAELADFADTAALIANLDLVISVDTAVAHLAAAMGKPVWLLLPFVPDWRWLLDREDSPWYPTMRLFRQASAGRWDGVVERVAERPSRRAPERDRRKAKRRSN